MPITAANLPSTAFVGNIGYTEIILVLLVILLLFGGRKLPELARGLGRGLRVFKDEVKGVKTDVESDDGEAKKLEHKDSKSSQGASSDPPRSNS